MPTKKKPAKRKKKAAKKKTKKKTKRRPARLCKRDLLQTGGLPMWVYIQLQKRVNEQLRERLRQIREEKESGNCKHCGASLYRGAYSTPAKKESE